MKIWIERNYYLGGFVMLAVVIATVVALALPAAAAPIAKEPEVPACEVINTASTTNGVIEIFYCEPKYGVPYKINSLGFMLNED